jgi:Domain of unknown function (DUF4290)
MNYYVKDESITLKEYGKLIQKYVKHIMLEEDRTKRTKMAYAVVDFMAQLAPSVKSTEDYKKKLWDHLFFIADYKLDVEAPYIIAEKEFIVPTPTKLDYPFAKNKHRHYGQYIVEFIEEAKKYDEDKRKVIAGPIASYMKVVHKIWNNEVVNDSIVKNDLSNFSEGMLEMADDESIRQLMPKGKMTNNQNQNRSNNQNNKNKKKKKNNNNSNNNNPNQNRNNQNRPNNNFKK